MRETKWPPLSVDLQRPIRFECSSFTLFGDQYSFGVRNSVADLSVSLGGKRKGAELRGSLWIVE